MSEHESTSAKTGPLVSVCVPVWNGRDLVGRAVESALSQSYPSIEVVVVDDTSTDGSAEYLRKRFGREIQLWRNRRNAGQARTMNASVAHSTGELVKFLHHDDYLHGDCIAKMVAARKQDGSTSLVFSRRSLELDVGADEGPEWRAAFEAIHAGFTELHEFDAGHTLLKQLFAAALRRNSIGEPSCVLVQRAAFDAAGGMNPKLRQYVDLDLWLRILVRGNVAFIDEELMTYRRSRNSTTGRNRAARRGWMDRLWIVEGLLEDPAFVPWREQLLHMRAEDRRMAWRTAIRGAIGMKAHAGAPGEWVDYAFTRVTRRLPAATTPRAGLPSAVDRVS